MTNTQNIILDLTNPHISPPPTVYAKQGDSGSRTVVAKIIDNGNDVTISAPCRVYFSGVGGGSPCYITGTVTSGAVTFTIPQTATMKSGTVKGEVQILNSENAEEVIATMSFDLVVKQTAYNVGAIVGGGGVNLADQYVDEVVSNHNASGEAHKKIQKNMSDLATEKANAALQSAKEYADIKAQSAQSSLESHNTNTTAHGDIRDKIALLQKYPSYEYTTSGGAVQRFDDVSVIPHTMGVTVHGATKYSKNLLYAENGDYYSSSNRVKVNVTDGIFTVTRMTETVYNSTFGINGTFSPTISGNYTIKAYGISAEPNSSAVNVILKNITDDSQVTNVFIGGVARTGTLEAGKEYQYFININSTNFNELLPNIGDYITFKVQLERGDTATAYEPYYAKSVTNPTVSVYGKNLAMFPTDASGNGITFSGSHCDVINPTVSYSTEISKYAKPICAGTYTLSAIVNGNVVYGSSNKKMLIYYRLNGELKTLTMTDENDVNVKLTDTFTVDSQSTFYVVRVWFPTVPASADLSIDVQLEVGSTATEYEPYIEPQTANPSITIGEGEVFKVETFNAVSPTMTVIATDDNALVSTVDVTYNRDIGKALGNLQAAIAALV